MKKRSKIQKNKKLLREEIIGLGDRSISKSYYPQLQEQMEALRLSEEKFRILYENNPLMLFTVDAAGVILSVNRNGASQLGYTVEELTGKSIFQIFSKDDHEVVKQQLAMAFEKPSQPSKWELQKICKDGRMLWVSESSQIIQIGDGKKALFIVCEDITERKKAEEELRKKTEELDRYFTNSLDLLCIADTDGYFRRLNPEWEKTLGYTISDLEGKQFMEFVHPDDIKSTREAVSRLASQKEVLNFVNRYRCKDGTYRWIEWRSYPEENIIFAVARDITERKKAENKLKEREEIFRLFIEYSPASIAMFDREMRYLAVSQRWLTDYGLGKKQIIGRSHYEIFPEIPERWKEVHRRCLAGAVEKAEEDPFVRADGNIDWVRWEIHPWKTATGEIGGIIIFSEVITERKKAEDEVKESYRKFTTLISNLNGMVYRCKNDPNWTTEFVSDGCVELTGYQPADLIGTQRIAYAELIHPDDRDRIWEEVQTAIEKRSAFQFTYWITTLSGKEKWVWEQGHPVFSDKGMLLGLEGFVTDITERKRAENKILRITRLYTVLSRINEAIVRIREPQELYEQVCKVVVEDGKFLMVWIGLVDPETSFIKPVAHYGHEEGYLDNIRISINPDIPEGRGPTGSAMREGRYFICNDIKNDPHMLPWREGALNRGYHSSAAFPLRTDSRIIGVINFYLSEPLFFKEEEEEEEEVKLLSALADDLSFAIEVMENEEKRKEAEESLRQAHKRIRSFIDANIVGVVIASASGKIIEANDYYLRMIGYTREEFEQGMVDWRAITPPEWIAADERAIKELRERGICTPYEKEYVRRDGTRVSVFLSDAMLPGPEEQIAAFVLDITERKQLEHEREKFIHLADSSSEFIGMCDLEMTPIYVNPAGIRMVGLSDMRAACSVKVQDYFFPEDQDFIRDEFFPRVLREGHGDVEIRLRHFQTGEPIWMFYYLFHVLDANGTPIGWATVSRDITERKRADEELRKYREHLEELVKDRTAELEEANTRLKELDRLKSMFIASMSHELRTPLNSVIGFSSILLKEWIGKLNDEQKNMSSIILKAGKHLLSLINDVIDVSKIEAGMIDIHHDDFDIDEVITDAVESLTKEIEDKGLLLNVETIHQRMHTDRSRLLQCILNLLSNAMKFTEKGSITVSVKQGASSKGQVARAGEKDLTPDPWHLALNGDFVEISVADTGIGIKEEDIPKLFQAFVRLESPLKTLVSGTGLGLYLTKKLVTEVLQGDITVESRYGEGSKFVMKIPITIKQ